MVSILENEVMQMIFTVIWDRVVVCFSYPGIINI